MQEVFCKEDSSSLYLARSRRRDLLPLAFEMRQALRICAAGEWRVNPTAGKRNEGNNPKDIVPLFSIKIKAYS